MRRKNAYQDTIKKLKRQFQTGSKSLIAKFFSEDTVYGDNGPTRKFFYLYFEDAKKKNCVEGKTLS